MPDDYQILIPPSFMALFVEPGKYKPNAPRTHIAQRYELCEDMANLLIDPAREQMFRLGITEDDVVYTIRDGLGGPDGVLTADEAGWVSARLFELLTEGRRRD